jgi:3-phosphoshikimate 1-carboxyvinyltransferase
MTDSPIPYPDALEIKPLDRPPTCTVTVPGSKSITNRALVLAALNPNGSVELRGALLSEDTDVMMGALRALGFDVQVITNRVEQVVKVSSEEGDIIPAESADLFVGNSGTTMRFLTAVLCLGEGCYRLDGTERMRQRPIGDLLDALRQLGVSAKSERGNGCPPIVLKAKGVTGGDVQIRGDTSSQFLSGLLMAAPLLRDGMSIRVDGPLISQPYVSLTVSMLRQWCKEVAIEDGRTFRIPGRQYCGVGGYHVEPDASAASYFFAAAAIAQGCVSVSGLTTHSLQGDIRFADVLENMGCGYVRGVNSLTIHGRSLRGIDEDMNDISDTVMTLAAVACFADGPTTIRNVAHIRHKETDRITALATELRKVGAAVEEYPDGLKITPRPLHGAEIETYNDHRMAMSMALIGLRVPGIIIKNPACVAKTYPRFWEDLERLRGA